MSCGPGWTAGSGTRPPAASCAAACPVGLVWGEADGEILMHPDEAVTGVIAAIFGQFAVCGSVRGVWLWLRDQGLKFPLQPGAYVRGSEIIWTEPTYHAVHNVLTHPAYAGAYTFGRSRQQRLVRDDGTLRVRRRVLPQDQWEVLIKDHHEGFIDWDTYQANQAQDRAEHPPGGASARHRRGPRGLRPAAGPGHLRDLRPQARRLLRGQAQGHPRLLLHRHRQLVEGRGTRHLRVGGVAIDAAVTAAFLAALEPVALQACLQAARQLEQGHDAALEQHRRQVEQARYQAARAERRYQAVDPDNRLVARGLEAAWEKALTELAAAEAELARRQAARPAALTAAERAAILALGDDLQAVWDAPTTTDKDRKQLLRTLLDEVNITVHRDHDSGHADLVLRWKGGAITELAIPVKRKPPRRLRTDEDTISLVRRLAVHYADAKIAGILNRQHRRTPRGLSYTAGRVQGLRHYWDIPRHQDTADDPRKESCSPWPTPPANSAWRPPPCTAGSATGSSAASSSPPAPPGGSGSPPKSAPCSSTTPPTAGWPCWRPPSPTASPARPSCNVSRTAGSAPSTSAPDAGKACVSNPQQPQDGLF